LYDIPETTGIVVRACLLLLQAKETLLKSGVTVSLSAQYVEIYDEKITDLLSGRMVNVRRESGDLFGASEASMDGGIADVMQILRVGHSNKHFAATAMNDQSSRSHTAFIVQITQTRFVPTTQSQKESEGQSNEAKVLGPETKLKECFVPLQDPSEPLDLGSGCSKLIKSQLHLVDLAGSERVKKSKATGVRMKEAVGINSSLLVLGKVIAALVECHHHVPYLVNYWHTIATSVSLLFTSLNIIIILLTTIFE
jgi:kinesin family protein C2/C3